MRQYADWFYRMDDVRAMAFIWKMALIGGPVKTLARGAPWEDAQ